MLASLQISLAQTLIDLQKRILYIAGVPVKRMIPKSGNRFSEKIMRKTGQTFEADMPSALLKPEKDHDQFPTDRGARAPSRPRRDVHRARGSEDFRVHLARHGGVFCIAGLPGLDRLSGGRRRARGRIVADRRNAGGWVFSAPNGGWEYPAFLVVLVIVQALIGEGAYALRWNAVGRPAHA